MGDVVRLTEYKQMKYYFQEVDFTFILFKSENQKSS